MIKGLLIFGVGFLAGSIYAYYKVCRYVVSQCVYTYNLNQEG